MQLDIFDHSHDTMLRNDVVHAIERHDAGAARSAWRIFRREFPNDDCLARLDVLVGALEHRTSEAFPDHDVLRHARCNLSQDVEPAAIRMMGEQAASTWLATLWRELALRSAQLAFLPARCDDHAAPMWLLGGEWQAAMAAMDAVAGIASWRRIPAPLAWMAEARFHLKDLDAALALLAELAWLSPQRFDDLTQRIADPRLEILCKKFDASFEGEGEVQDLAWFPAWLLTEKPGLAHLLGETQRSLDTAPEQAMRVLLELLGLERQGRHHDMVARRKVLRGLHPSLYAANMATR